MRAILDTTQGELLQIRVYVARTLGVFSFKDLTEEWGISLSTLHRYSSPQYRELSRQLSRRQTDMLRETNKAEKGRCRRCQEPLEGHARCIDCTILLHETPLKRCGSCIDAYHHRTMRSTYGISL